MSYKLTGALKFIGPTNQVSEKFAKRDIVITDNASMYPQDIVLQLSQDKTTLADLFNVGDIVEVSFNLRGREWANPSTGEIKYFNTLDAWRIEKQQGGQPAATQSNTQNTQPAPIQAPAGVAGVSDDDLPF